MSTKRIAVIGLGQRASWIVQRHDADADQALVGLAEVGHGAVQGA